MSEQRYPDVGPDVGHIDAVCDFILRWYGERASAGTKPVEGAVMPHAVGRVLRKLGHLWEESSRGLFSVQNTIVHPAQFDNAEVQAFSVENQGVTNFGFDPEAPEQLLVVSSG